MSFAGTVFQAQTALETKSEKNTSAALRRRAFLWKLARFFFETCQYLEKTTRR